jgi:hypothetical protein
MKLNVRINAFAVLGEMIRNGLSGKDAVIAARLNPVIERQQSKNEWFTPENVRMSLEAIAEQLTPENLEKWISAYPELEAERNPVNIAVIMAGNIPLVGFHDFLSVLIAGNRIIVRTSSRDSDLIRFISSLLTEIEPGFQGRISFTEGILTGFDGIIATGSNNSSRYFEYYFGKYPNIIRKNRNSIAIIEGNETNEELQGFAKDIFSYFGLGCRNISKIYVPGNYDFSMMIRNLEAHSHIVNHSKYANNYDYNKAIYLVNRQPFIDTGYLLLKEDKRLASPVAVVYYEYYDTPEKVNEIAVSLSDRIQCISGRKNVSPGRAQMPNLWDYADGIDTMEFMLKKFSVGNIVK